MSYSYSSNKFYIMLTIVTVTTCYHPDYVHFFYCSNNGFLVVL